MKAFLMAVVFLPSVLAMLELKLDMHKNIGNDNYGTEVPNWNSSQLQLQSESSLTVPTVRGIQSQRLCPAQTNKHTFNLALLQPTWEEGNCCSYT
jgi:hypothetical protein